MSSTELLQSLFEVSTWNDILLNMFQVVMATMIITTHYQWKYHLHLHYSNPLIKKEKPSSNLQLVNLGDNFLKKKIGREIYLGISSVFGL